MDAKNHKPISYKLFDIPITPPSKGDCKRRRRFHVTIMDLPTVIIVEILSRLPIKPIFQCKTVCKLWYHLLTKDPLFLNMYYTRSRRFPCILLSEFHSNLSFLELKADYDYYSHPCNRPIALSPKFHLPPVESNMSLIGSCNGFICLLNGSGYDENHSIYINNPLLGEYFKVKLPEWEKSVWFIDYGFCFSKASGQYKVLRLVTRKFQGRPEVSELEVYTLGVDEKWQNVGQVQCYVWYHLGNVNVNGALHWMDHHEHSIYSFDFGTEKLKFLSPPTGLKSSTYCLRLAELGNCLCLIDFNFKQRFDIWRIKEYGVAESWTKTDSILVDSLPPGMGMHAYQVILIWKDGEILIEMGGRLASYNPKENKSKEVHVYGSGTAATKYTPSFYSFKTVMGDEFQVSYVYSKPQII